MHIFGVQQTFVELNGINHKVPYSFKKALSVSNAYQITPSSFLISIQNHIF